MIADWLNCFKGHTDHKRDSEFCYRALPDGKIIVFTLRKKTAHNADEGQPYNMLFTK